MSGDYKEWWRALAKPFKEDEYEWRLAQCGKSGNGKFWALCLCYLTNRAIQQRLDDVVGAENWKNEYIGAPDGGILCGIYIRVNGEWIVKWDGAENTQVEAVKGGLSDSMKRTAVQWGMGRCLYKLKETFAVICDKKATGSRRGRTKDKEEFYWKPPPLPVWAVDGKTDDSGKKLPSKAGEEKKGIKPPTTQPLSSTFLNKMGIAKGILKEHTGDNNLYYITLEERGYKKSNQVEKKNQEEILTTFRKLAKETETLSKEGK